jgi:hypothetical protein
MQKKAAILRGGRLGILQTLLANNTDLTTEQQAAALADMKAGDLTSTSILNTFRTHLAGDDGELTREDSLTLNVFTGLLNSRFKNQSMGDDYGGTKEGVDAYLRAVDQGPPDISLPVHIMKKLSGRGAFGMRALRAFAAAGAEGDTNPGWGDLFTAIMGNNDIANQDLAGFIGVSDELVKDLEARGDKKNLKLEEGINISLQSLQNNTYRNKTLTAEQQEEFRAPWAKGLTLEERITKFEKIGDSLSSDTSVNPMGDLTEVLTRFLQFLQNMTGNIFNPDGTGSTPKG